MPVFANPLRSFLASVGARLGDWAKDNPAEAEDLRWLLEVATARDANHDPPLVEHVFRSVFPPNWWELQVSIPARAQTTMIETGVCLVWVPRADVVREITSAEGSEARDGVMVAWEREILADVTTVLDEVTSPRLADLASAGREAVAAYRGGQERASQALSAAIVTTVLSEHFGMPKFSVAEERLGAEHPSAGGIRVLRRRAVQWALRGAVVRSDRDESERYGFSRHKTLHSLDSDQYTLAHALSALLLIGGALRELQDLYAVGNRGVPFVASAPMISR